MAYDPFKLERNIRERRLSFERASKSGFAAAVYLTEVRGGEERRVAVGYLDQRLHVLCYIPKPDGIRVINFRKANRQEAKRYSKPETVD